MVATQYTVKISLKYSPLLIGGAWPRTILLPTPSTRWLYNPSFQLASLTPSSM